MSNEFAKSLLTEQRKRLVGSLMQFIEAEVYPSLPTEKRQALRQKVLTSVAAYHDVCLDMLKAVVPSDQVANEETLVLIRSIHSMITEEYVEAGDARG